MLAAASASAATYAYFDLGEGDAYGINNAGQVVGLSNSGGVHATLWNGAVTINLGT
ncbi:MAG: hypothetical protein JF617_15880, partial [Burkholderiales bacterium]|nr:hypothetical protein [Burkholderiales bacterium]